MVQSLDVSARPTFSQIAQQFEGVKSNSHLRLKEGEDGGTTLYAHSGKFSLSGHGMLTKQATIMERRNEATKMVIDAFKQEFKDHSKLVDRVLEHVMSDDSFEKVGGLLQLRTGDVKRLDELMRSEIETSGLFSSEMARLGTTYSSDILRFALGTRFDSSVSDDGEPLMLGRMDEDQVRDVFAGGLKEAISLKSSEALFDEGVQSMFDGGVKGFRAALSEHAGIMLTPDFLGSPQLGTLKPLLGIALALVDISDSRSQGANFSVALKLSTGSDPTTPPPEPRDRPKVPSFPDGSGPPARVARERVERAIVVQHDLNIKALNDCDRDSWMANELSSRFFEGETPLIGLEGEKLQQLKGRLKELDDRISELRSQLPDTEEMERILRSDDEAKKHELNDLCGRLDQAGRAKLTAISDVVDECIGTELEKPQPRQPMIGGHRGTNPVLRALEPMTDEVGRAKARALSQEMSGLQR